MLRFGIAALALSSMLATALGAPAHAQSAPAATAARFDLKFRPPLGRILRFQLSMIRYRDGKPTLPEPVGWVEELRYERAEQGYTLYWRMDPASLPPAMRSPLLAAALKPYVGDPIAFDLDADGAVKRVQDWPRALAGLRSGVTSARGLLLLQPGATPAVVDKALAAIMRQFDGLTAETAPDIILQNISPILGWGAGMSMAVGETRKGDVDVPVALYGISVKSHATAMLTAADAQSATIVSREWVDAAELKRLSTAMAGSLGVKPTAIDDLNLASLVTVFVDGPTGLVAKFDLESREGAEGPLVQRKQISWLR